MPELLLKELWPQVASLINQQSSTCYQNSMQYKVFHRKVSCFDGYVVILDLWNYRFNNQSLSTSIKKRYKTKSYLGHTLVNFHLFSIRNSALKFTGIHSLHRAMVLGIPLKGMLVGPRRRILWFLTLAVWTLFISSSKSTSILQRYKLKSYLGCTPHSISISFQYGIQHWIPYSGFPVFIELWEVKIMLKFKYKQPDHSLFCLNTQLIRIAR